MATGMTSVEQQDTFTFVSVAGRSSLPLQMLEKAVAAAAKAPPIVLLSLLVSFGAQSAGETSPPSFLQCVVYTKSCKALR